MAKDYRSGKLAVILHADIAGSTALVQLDEQVAHERIQETFRRFGDAIIKYQGHVRELRGDALLAEFDRASDAVTAAISFQAAQVDFITQLDDSIRPTVRVGIAMGEVIIADDTITGAGVVLAQRLEQLSEPGGVVIQGAAYETIPGRFPFEYGDLGEHKVKGFDKPVRVYSAKLKSDRDIPQPGPLVHRTRNKIIAFASIAVIIAGIALMWLKPWVIREEPASLERMAFPLPDKPSIAVLPFTNLSADSEQEYFSDGITQDIITNLARFPDLFVISRNSTFTYKGQSVMVKQVAEELGVRYVLEGSVQKAGKKLRITAQLIDATTGYHLWAKSYDRNLVDLFAVRDEVTQSIVATLSGDYGELQQAELERLQRKDTKNFDAYDYVLRAIHIWLDFTRDANSEAGRLAEKAIELDPEYARAPMMLAWVHLNEYRWKWSDDPEKSLQQAYEMARKSVELDDSDSWSHWALGVVYLYRGDHEDAIAQYEKALALNPNDADVLAHMGLPLSFAGRPEQAMEQIKRAKRLNPAYPPWYPWILGWAQVVAEQYEASIASSKEAAIHFPTAEVHLNLAVAYHYLGRAAKARAAVQESLRIDPELNLDGVKAALPFADPADLERFHLALRKAGLPEHPPLLLPDKPSIAVLPFTNMSNDAEQEYFVDGMTEDLITDLSKLSGLFVIARNSVFTYKGKSVKIRQVAEELGVRYVLEGSVRRVGDQVRINAQLIDTTTGGHLWAERYDGSLANVFALQDSVTRKIVTALAINLTEAEQTQTTQNQTDHPEAYDAFLQGWAYYILGTRADLARAKPFFEEAIRLDSGYARAHAALAVVYWDVFVNDWSIELDILSFEAEEGWEEHLELAMKVPNALAHTLQSKVLVSQSRYQEAVVEAEKAVALDGNKATAYAGLANALILAGNPAEGADLIRKSMRLDPHHPPGHLTTLGQAQFEMEQFKEAAATFERAVKRNVDDDFPWIYLAASYGYMGRPEDANDSIVNANDVRAKRGEMALSLESKSDDWYSPFRGEIDFSRFGEQQAQERLRAGLTGGIPALTWQYLVTPHPDGENTWFEVKGATVIDAHMAKSLHDRNVKFIDSRTEAYRNEGWIPGAVHLSDTRTVASTIHLLTEETLAKIVDKTDEVVFYCDDRAFQYSAFASAKALSWGYQKVFYFLEGFRGWKEAGYPVETVK